MEYLDPKIVEMALAAALLVKGAVDLVKLGIQPVPQWAPPALAAVLGPLIVGLLMVAGGAAITAQAGAQAILAGFLAAMLAVGSTELGVRAAYPKTKNWGGGGEK